ncbi:MAG: hypothetical protein ABEI52_06585 [Halobacteriaceae archaeon]
MNSLDYTPRISLSTMRLYGSAIAIVSGTYSILSGSFGIGMVEGGMMGMTPSGGAGMVMVLVGIIVLVHGIVLLTPLAQLIRAASGPLMLAYAILMLLIQAWVGLSMNAGMGPDNEMMSGSRMIAPITADMGLNIGMVAIAILMFISGLIMTVRSENEVM